MNLNTVFEKIKKLPWRELEGSVVVVDIDHEDCLSFNELASFIWLKIDGQDSVLNIIQQVTDEYEISNEEAAKDTILFLKNCEEKGFIKHG